MTSAFIFILLIFSCCNNNVSKGNNNVSPNNNIVTQIENEQVIRQYSPIYAKTYNITRSGQNDILTILNPWQGAHNYQKSYTLYDRYNTQDSIKALTDLSYIPTPLHRVVCLSSTHIAYMEALSAQECIVGVSGAKYISSPKVTELLSTGKIADVGYENNLDYEKILSLAPDAVIAYCVSQESLGYVERLQELGIRVITIGEYVENTPLGKAEHLVEFGYLLGKSSTATEIFSNIASQYNNLCRLLSTSKASPVKVLLNLPYKELWYIPGGKNYISQFIKDAGGELLGSDLDKVESSVIPLEQAYLLAQEAQFWLHPNAFTSLKELYDFLPMFSSAPCAKQGRVFNNNLRITKSGGSDFWESGVVNPHLILADLIAILHPTLLSDHKLVYYRELK